MAKWWTPNPEKWRGRTAVVIAGGTSVTPETLDYIRFCTQGRGVIAVNSVYRFAPWAGYCVFQDARWWDREGRVNLPALRKFRGRFVTTKQSLPVPSGVRPPLRYAKRSALTSLRPALLVAADHGAKRIVLVGADNREDDEGNGHFHTEHPWPRSTPNYWGDKYNHLKKVAKDLDKRGVEVCNVSPISTLDFWPYVPLGEVLDT